MWASETLAYIEAPQCVAHVRKRVSRWGISGADASQGVGRNSSIATLGGASTVELVVWIHCASSRYGELRGEMRRARAASGASKHGYFDAVRILHSTSHTVIHAVPVALCSLTFDRLRCLLSKCTKVYVCASGMGEEIVLRY